MDRIYDNHIHIAIDSAVKSKISSLRIHILEYVIINLHSQCVSFAELNGIGYIKPEDGVTTFMLTEMLSVHINVRHTVGSMEFNEYAIPLLT
ncbi:hypothetical protein D3C85_1459660 [compost metagenome]